MLQEASPFPANGLSEDFLDLNFDSGAEGKSACRLGCKISLWPSTSKCSPPPTSKRTDRNPGRRQVGAGGFAMDARGLLDLPQRPSQPLLNVLAGFG